MSVASPARLLDNLAARGICLNKAGHDRRARQPELVQQLLVSRVAKKKGKVLMLNPGVRRRLLLLPALHLVTESQSAERKKARKALLRPALNKPRQTADCADGHGIRTKNRSV